jgi:hypothetical protein
VLNAKRFGYGFSLVFAKKVDGFAIIGIGIDFVSGGLFLNANIINSGIECDVGFCNRKNT